MFIILKLELGCHYLRKVGFWDWMEVEVYFCYMVTIEDAIKEIYT